MKGYQGPTKIRVDEPYFLMMILMAKKRGGAKKMRGDDDGDLIYTFKICAPSNSTTDGMKSE
jgi:hypothetical protein